MFNPNQTLIDAFVSHICSRFEDAFPAADPQDRQVLEQSARSAMETLLNCDCPYHDIQHTMLVSEVGQTILRGKQLVTGSVTAEDWLHVIIALLFHDIGYVRGLLAADNDDTCLVDFEGNRVTPPPGCTDAYLTPYHVTRGCLYVRDRFTRHPRVDLRTITHYIEMTRFPVPKETFYQRSDDYAGLVRAADLLGQMADPLYLQKLSRLYAEFLETGEALRLGIENAGELRAGFPDFYYSQVQPYIGEGLRYLKKTQDGHQWIANLHHHLHTDDSHDVATRAPELRLEGLTVVPLKPAS